MAFVLNANGTNGEIESVPAPRFVRPNRSRPLAQAASNVERPHRLRGPSAHQCIRNIRMMHMLERVAEAFNGAKVPLLVLKGAALNLTIYRQPDERPMSDLDLMVHTADLESAIVLLHKLGFRYTTPLVRDDFFPRFHFERELVAGTMDPLKIDLHVRPLRPLRFAALLPADALWSRSERVQIGFAHILIPSAEDMLIHLTSHLAVHGDSRRMWRCDIKDWIAAYGDRIDWQEFVKTVDAWRLSSLVRRGMDAVEREFGAVWPPAVTAELRRRRINWRDRLVLWQAPRDMRHPVMHVMVNAVCTPSRRLVLGYLWAMMLPGREHMAKRYWPRHRGWLVFAHLARWLGPIGKRLRPLRRRLATIEVRPSNIHGFGVFPTRGARSGTLIARYRGRPATASDAGAVVHRHLADNVQYVVRGKLRFLNHSCRPNARLVGFDLIALRCISAGEEITIDYGGPICSCRKSKTRRDVASNTHVHAVA